MLSTQHIESVIEHTIFIASLTPVAIWVLSAILTSCLVMFSSEGSTEF